MILYVNGDSHAAGAQAVNDYCFANDDFTKVALGRKPHPDNLNASWGMHLSKMLNLALVCDAEAGCSNERILRTTQEFINKNYKKSNFMIVIGWTNWTRTEWIDETTNQYIQINASFSNTAPEHMQTKFRQYVARLNFFEKQARWNDTIYQLHLELTEKSIPHLFFNANDDLKEVPNHMQKDWNNCYLNPYSPNNYIKVCLDAGYKHNEWYHFKQDAHLFWAQHLFNYLTEHKISI